jgi:hypothetical protein
MQPWQIKVNDEKAVVGFLNLIQIYDSLTFTHIFASVNTQDYWSGICLFNDLLINTQGGGFHFYDMQGKLVKRIDDVLNADPQYRGFDVIANKLILTNRNNILSIFE